MGAEPAAPDPTKPESQAPMEDTPLPCPFCGGPAMIAEYGDGQHIVFCASCDCHPSPEETASDALASWNRRSAAPDPIYATFGDGECKVVGTNRPGGIVTTANAGDIILELQDRISELESAAPDPRKALVEVLREVESFLSDPRIGTVNYMESQAVGQFENRN